MDINNHPPYMFDNRKVDYFFRWSWWVVPVIYLPLSLMFFVVACIVKQEMVTNLVVVAAGIFLWTLFEYAMHRFLFHAIGKSPSLKHLHYVVHGMHHAYSTDPMRVIFPPFASFAVGTILAAIFFLIFPVAYALSLLGGVCLGYVWYEFIHYAAHHIKWNQSHFKRLKRHHLLHHHSKDYSERNFGVTTALWDRIFKTHTI